MSLQSTGAAAQEKEASGKERDKQDGENRKQEQEHRQTSNRILLEARRPRFVAGPLTQTIAVLAKEVLRHKGGMDRWVGPQKSEKNESKRGKNSPPDTWSAHQTSPRVLEQNSHGAGLGDQQKT